MIGKRPILSVLGTVGRLSGFELADKRLTLIEHFRDHAEILIARDEEKPYFLLAGRASGKNKKPKAALPTDKMYEWTWEILKKLIAGGR